MNVPFAQLLDVIIVETQVYFLSVALRRNVEVVVFVRFFAD